MREHVLDSENSMVKTLNKRVGAMKKIQKTASFKSRKMIGTGIFLSKLIYLKGSMIEMTSFSGG